MAFKTSHYFSVSFLNYHCLVPVNLLTTHVSKKKNVEGKPFSLLMFQILSCKISRKVIFVNAGINFFDDCEKLFELSKGRELSKNLKWNCSHKLENLLLKYLKII